MVLTKEGSIVQPKINKVTSQSTNRVARRNGEKGDGIAGQNKLIVIRKSSPSRPSSKTKHYVTKLNSNGNGSYAKPIIIPKLALQNIQRQTSDISTGGPTSNSTPA